MVFLQLDLPEVKYEYFDFHGECKNMRWDRINGLIDRLEGGLEKYTSVVFARFRVFSILTTDLVTSRLTQTRQHPHEFKVALFAPIAWITLIEPMSSKLLSQNILLICNSEIWVLYPPRMISTISN